jgi:ribosomal protein S18 acetylase RimI-like enzyme
MLGHTTLATWAGGTGNASPVERPSVIVARMGATVVPVGECRSEVATFIAARNADDTQHIGYVDTVFDDIDATLADLYEGAVFALARDEDGALTGVLGAEWDTAIGRTWLYGPWGDHADALYAAVVPHVPAQASEHELYCAEANMSVVQFAERHGFGPGSASVVYEFARDRLPLVAEEPMMELAPRYREQFAALHTRTFPHASATAKALAVRQPAPLVDVTGDRLRGYVVLRLTPESGTGELDFLAVDEEFQGQGIGARLGRAALRQAFADPRMQTVVLSTNADNSAGQRLYERIGFTRGRPMRGFRKR